MVSCDIDRRSPQCPRLQICRSSLTNRHSRIATSHSLLTNRRLLLDADYISVWPRQVTFDDYERGRIVILPVRLPTTAGTIGIITRSGAELSPSAEALIQTIRNVASALLQTAPPPVD